MKYYLSIDPGTHCGYAVVDESGNIIASGTWDLSPRRHEGGGMRFVRLNAYLRGAADVFTPSAMWYEEVRRHLGTDAAHIYGGIVAVISGLCEMRNIPYAGIPVATVKKLATGKGNADKAAMLAATRTRWADFAGDDNEADARWIGIAGLISIGVFPGFK